MLADIVLAARLSATETIREDELRKAKEMASRNFMKVIATPKTLLCTSRHDTENNVDALVAWSGLVDINLKTILSDLGMLLKNKEEYNEDHLAPTTYILIKS